MGACSICGFPYRYPSELIYADDRLFYCKRTCWLGKTKLQDDREVAAAHKRRGDEISPKLPLAPPGDYEDQY